MTDIYKYKLYCEDDVAWVEKWDELIEEDEITCPNDINHTVTSGSVSIVERHIDTGPVMSDGRPLIRSDTRPLDTQTYFTMVGDCPTTGDFGCGNEMRWDFSNDDDLYDSNDLENGPTTASGYKCKRIDLVFTDPVYLKDGTIYFFDAPWGANGSMYITVPAGSYYPNPNGSIPASALGLPGEDMYSYATKDVFYACYVNKHFMYGSCAMGDELNAEGCQVDAVPAGWFLTAMINIPESDTMCKGFISFEMYRHSISTV